MIIYDTRPSKKNPSPANKEILREALHTAIGIYVLEKSEKKVQGEKVEHYFAGKVQ